MTDSYDSHDETLLADAYDDACLLLATLDKRIVQDRYTVTDNDPLVRVRWQLAQFIHDYDKGEALEYADYLWLVARAQDALGDRCDET